MLKLKINKFGAEGGLGLTTALGYLKNYYFPNGMWVELINDSPMLTNIRTMGEQMPITGEVSQFSLQHTRQSGVRIATEIDDLPDVNPRKNVKGSVFARQIYGRTSIDHFTIATTRNNAGAFMSALVERFDSLIDDLGNAVQLSAWTNENGRLGNVTDGVANGATPLSSVEVTNVVRFEAGIKVQLYALTAGGIPTGVALGTFEIIDYDIDANKIFVSPNNSILWDSTGNGQALLFNTTALGIDTQGVEGQMSLEAEVTTLNGIDRSVSAYTFYQASQVPNSANLLVPEILDENVLRKAKTRSKLLAPKSRGQAFNRRIYGGLEELDGYETTVLNDRRYPSTGGTPPDYSTGKAQELLMFDNILLETDKYAKGEEVELMSMGSWNMHTLEDESWMDMDGSMMSRIQNKPGYEGSNYMFWNMSNKNPRENVRIQGVLKFDPIA